jgi:hypothetical protein
MYLVECNPDEVLIRTVTITSRKNIKHSGNKSELLKALSQRFDNSKGLVDEDPWSIQPPYLDKFHEKQDLTGYNIKILEQKSKNNTIVMLRPRLEDWILQAAKEANVSPAQFGLPDEATKLHEQINVGIDKFQKLLDALKTSKRLQELKKALSMKQ